MCYQGCRYELTWGDSAGECSLPNGEKPPIDAMCEIDDIHAENAMLREELAKARDPQRIGGQADPSSFAYAIEQLREFRWQHATNDEDAIPYINNVAAAHERENAKLMEELVQWERLTACIKLPEYPITDSKPKDLERENAKLRELVRDMWCCISHIGEYDVFYYDMAEDGCGMSCTVNGEHCCADKLHDRMRKLGIEVEA